MPSLKQDLIGGRAVTNGLDFQVILDKNPHDCGIYPRINGKLCGIERSIPFISDDWRLFRLKTLNLVRHSFVKKTGLDLWHKRYYCTNCGPFEWNREYSQEDSKGHKLSRLYDREMSASRRAISESGENTAYIAAS